MTEVFYTRENGAHELYVTGHAGYAPAGQDIVCSAISSIGYTLLGYLVNSDDEPDVSYIDEPGRLVVICEATAHTDVAFEMALIGLAQIAQAYPPFIHVRSAESGDSRERPRMTHGKDREERKEHE